MFEILAKVGSEIWRAFAFLQRPRHTFSAHESFGFCDADTPLFFFLFYLSAFIRECQRSHKTMGAPIGEEFPDADQALQEFVCVHV